MARQASAATPSPGPRCAAPGLCSASLPPIRRSRRRRLQRHIWNQARSGSTAIPVHRETKRSSARLIAAAGGRYVDVAIMAPVHPKLNHTPLLLAGEWAVEAADALRALDMRPEVAGDRVGDASSIKMIRSVMIKGLEALTAECMLAARRAGVEQAVLASLEASDPGIEWRKRGAYSSNG